MIKRTDERRKPTGGRSPADGMAGGERPTLKTIAFMTGLGVTTVSRALKDAPEIGADTRRRVRTVAAQIGYRPNRAGVRLRTGKTNVISLILDTQDDVMGITSNMVYGISEVLADTPYHLVITPYARSRDPMEPVRYVLETGSADGVIISRTEPDDARVRYLMENRFPFATHGRTEMGLAHAFHDFDNEAFARQSVARLAGRGRKRLSLIAPPPHLTYHHHMMNGFSEAVREHGLGEVTIAGVDTDRRLADIRSVAERVMSGPHPPDGLVCGSAGSAVAVVAGLEAAGARLGRDVDICAKQTSDFLPWFRSQIVAFSEDVRAGGRELARAVLAHIDGRDPATLQTISQPRAV